MYATPQLPVGVPLPELPIHLVDEEHSQSLWAGQSRLAAKLQVSRSLCGSALPSPSQPELVLYYHQDHLGSTQYLTDQCAALVEHSEYLPNGQSWINDQSSDVNINNPNSFDPASQYRFTGKEQDPETGFYYYGARYFDPKAQIWISPDPILGGYMAGKPNGGVFSPVNLALYSYAANNPIRYVDPDGRAFFIPLLIFGGQALSVLSAGLTSYEAASAVRDVATGDKTVGQTVSERAPEVAVSVAGGVVGKVALKWGRKVYSARETHRAKRRAEAASKAANDAQKTTPRPGAAGVVEKDGVLYPNQSVRGDVDPQLHPQIQEMLDAIPPEQRGRGHGRCVEPQCYSDMLYGKVDPKGSVADVRTVRKEGHPDHNVPLPACTSCEILKDKLGAK